MIEVQSLSRRFGTTLAVDDVSFSLGSNEVVGLLGHNGAGKTTMMRMLCGYLEPSTGRIVIDGVDMAVDCRAIQRQLGYLPENLPLYPDMMVADYLEYAATLKGISRRQRAGAVRAALKATDLAERALDRIGILSRGFRQRVGVAQALLGQPRLLVLDEPTNGLDPGQTGHMRALIRQLAQEATVILSTHILQEASAVCDRVLMLRNGRLALDRSLAELRDGRTLSLRASACPPSLPAIIDALPAVASVDVVPAADGELRLDIHLRADADRDTTSNDIALAVIDAGARLHQIDSPARDLDSVFREVYARGD